MAPCERNPLVTGEFSDVNIVRFMPHIFPVAVISILRDDLDQMVKAMKKLGESRRNVDSEWPCWISSKYADSGRQYVSIHIPERII